MFFEDVIKSVYDYAIKTGTKVKIDNVDTTAIIKNGSTLISATPFNLGSLVQVNNVKYLVTDIEKQFRQSIYSKGTIEETQKIKVNNNTIYGTVKFGADITDDLGNVNIVADKYIFTIPYANVNINDTIIYNNMEFKVENIDYSKINIIVIYASYKNKTNNYTIELNNNAVTLKATETYKIENVCKDNNVIVTNPTIIYSSSDTDIATVNQSGIVTAIKEGSCIISCNYNGAIATLTVTVNQNITLTPIKIVGEENINVGETETYTICVDDGDEFSAIPTATGRTFKFILEDSEDTGEIISTTYNTVTIKALKKDGLIVLNVTDNADDSINSSKILYGI